MLPGGSGQRRRSSTEPSAAALMESGCLKDWDAANATLEQVLISVAAETAQFHFRHRLLVSVEGIAAAMTPLGAIDQHLRLWGAKAAQFH